MKVIGVIPARFQSSRFPGKPLVDILGKPMIWWVFQQCMKVKDLDEVIIATDDIRIQDTCLEYNMPVIMTSDKHVTGSDRVGEVASKVDGDIFINIQGDEPVIPPQMIQQVIDIFNDKTVNFGTLRKEITDKSEILADSTVKVVVNTNNDALFFSRNVIPSNLHGDKKGRVFRHVGIYGYTREFLLMFSSMKQTELELAEGIEPLRILENGYKIRVEETQLESIGVDYPKHIEHVEKIMKQSKVI